MSQAATFAQKARMREQALDEPAARIEAPFSLKRAVVWALMVMMLVPVFFGLFAAAPGTGGLFSVPAAFAEEGGDEPEETSEQESIRSSYSFYTGSANLAEQLSDAMEPGNIQGAFYTKEYEGDFDDEASWYEFWRGEGDVGTNPRDGSLTDIRRSPAMAGSFIGYLDPSVLDHLSRVLESGFSDFLASAISGSSASMSYDSLSLAQQEVGMEDGLSWGDGFYEYALFGATLNDAGLDNTSMGAASFFPSNPADLFMGIILWAAWWLSTVTDALFSFVISLLIALNPFRLFFEAVGVTSGQEYADGMVAGEGSPEMSFFGYTPGNMDSWLVGLTNFINGWYQLLYNLSWQVIFPIFVAVFILGALMFKKMDKGAGLKKLLVRGMFIVFGVPLMGSLYSATLDTMSDGMNPGQSGASQAVLSTLVDFEAWATNHRLAVPQNATIEWDNENGGASSDTIAMTRANILAINAMSYDGVGGPGDIGVGSWSADDPDQWAQQQQNMQTVGGGDVGALNETGSGGFTEAVMDPEQLQGMDRMIRAYIFGEQISASAFETSVMARLSATSSNIKVGAYEEWDSGDEDDPGQGSHRAERWLEQLERGTVYNDRYVAGWIGENTENSGGDRNGVGAAWDSSDEVFSAKRNPLIAVRHGDNRTEQANYSGLRANWNGRTDGDPLNTGVVSFSTARASGGSVGAGGHSSDHPSRDHCTNNPYQVWSEEGFYCDYNLSPMAMFNYLNTSFGPTEMVMYSSENVASAAVRETHESVNVGGTGVLSWLLVANTIVMIVAMVVIGLIYAFAMLFGAFKRTFQLIAGVPFAILGVMSGIAKVIVYSLALILQTIGTIFVYMVVIQLLISLPQIIEAPLMAFMLWVWGGSDVTGILIIAITMLASIFFYLIFTVMAIRMRSSAMKAMEEAMTKVIEKFLNAESGGSSGGGLGNLGRAATQAAASGAGMAGANRLMTGGFGNKDKDKESGAAGTGGQSAVEAATSTPAGTTLDGRDSHGRYPGQEGYDPSDTSGEYAQDVAEADSMREEAAREAEGGGAGGTEQSAVSSEDPSKEDADGQVVAAKNGLSLDGSGYGSDSEKEKESESEKSLQEDADGQVAAAQYGPSLDGTGYGTQTEADKESASSTESESDAAPSTAAASESEAASRADSEKEKEREKESDSEKSYGEVASEQTQSSMQEDSEHYAEQDKDGVKTPDGIGATRAAGETGVRGLAGDEDGAAEKAGEVENKIAGEQPTSSLESHTDSHSADRDSERTAEAKDSERMSEKDGAKSAEALGAAGAAKDPKKDPKKRVPKAPKPAKAGAKQTGQKAKDATKDATKAVPKSGQTPKHAKAGGPKVDARTSTQQGDTKVGGPKVASTHQAGSATDASKVSQDQRSTSNTQSNAQSKTESTQKPSSAAAAKPARSEGKGRNLVPGGLKRQPGQESRLGAATKGGGKGAAKGAIRGAAVGVVGGPKGMAAGAKTGAIAGGARGAQRGLTHRDSSGRMLPGKSRKQKAQSAKPAPSKSKQPSAAPKQAPKQQAPKQQAPKQQAPKQQAPKQQAPKQQAPKPASGQVPKATPKSFDEAVKPKDQE